MINQYAKRTALCECTGSAFIASDTARVEFFWPGSAPRGGQFFLIKPDSAGVFLGRPISAAGWKPGADGNSGAGERGGVLSFIIASRGRGSRELVQLKPGDKAELIGPLGKGWEEACKFYNVPYGNAALVAGGVGIAPLLLLIQEMGERPFDLYAGFRTGSFGLEDIKSGNLIIATEDGSLGKKGRITDFFTPSAYNVVFACGPEPMLRVVSQRCKAETVPCFVSMEKHMACGVGACLGCTVKTVSGNRRCCADGPVFNAAELCYDE